MMYIFLGLLYTKEDEVRLLKNSKVGLQGAANNFQWGLIYGLAGAGAERVCVVNSVPMGTFPRHCKTLFEKSHDIQMQDADIHCHGYINLPIIKQIQRNRFAYRKLKQIISQSDEPVTVIAYSLYAPYMSALYKLKKETSRFRYLLVVPDLPGKYGIESRNPVIRYIQRIRGSRAMKLSKSADGYIALTEQIADLLADHDKPYTIVEGIFNGKIDDAFEYKRGDIPVILYTGALDAALGLDTLLTAFRMLPAGTAKLYLAGAGPYSEEIKKACLENEDIVYLGYRTKKDIDELQRGADVLVNPRSGDEAYTKYSFPSKTIEYLSTGVPVVMNRLPGIPEEYNQHLFLTERSNAASLAKTLRSVLEMDETILSARGQRSRQFILEEKSGVPQACKIIELEKRVNKKQN